ncbi:MAG: RpiB/LacA/LacB family sugar-phosphate isomerase [bacterium]
MKKIIIGADHRGFDLKRALIEKFTEYEWIDIGTSDKEKTDYPIYAKKLCDLLLSGQGDFGILICGSGIGMSIAANRFPGIYAGLCWNEQVAKLAKEDDGVNVLVLPSELVLFEDAFLIFKAWLDAKFKDGRYKERILMIDKKY